MPLDSVPSQLDLFLDECIVHRILVTQGTFSASNACVRSLGPQDPFGADRRQTSSDSFEDVMRGFCVELHVGVHRMYVVWVVGRVALEKGIESQMNLFFFASVAVFPLPKIIIQTLQTQSKSIIS